MNCQRDAAPFLIPSNKPQLHSRKCHHTYNATRSLPIAIWIRSLRFGLDLNSSPSSSSNKARHHNHNHHHHHHRSSSPSSDDGSDDDEDDQAVLRAAAQDAADNDNDALLDYFFPSNTSCTVLYEIVLYYDHNRACTIYRTPEDFAKLKEAVTPANKYLQHGNRKWVVHSQQLLQHHGLASNAVEDVEDLQRFLSKTISRKGRDCPALEYFLRRRMNDCGGK